MLGWDLFALVDVDVEGSKTHHFPPMEASGDSGQCAVLEPALHETLNDSVASEFRGPFGEQALQETVKWIRGIVG